MNNCDENRSMHIVVEGHVQGVGFRYFVQEKANYLSISGWVRNRYDGSVEIMAQGSSDQIRQLLDAIRIGPSRSMVTDVKFNWEMNIPEYSQFSMLPTD